METPSRIAGGTPSFQLSKVRSFRRWSVSTGFGDLELALLGIMICGIYHFLMAGFTINVNNAKLDVSMVILSSCTISNWGVRIKKTRTAFACFRKVNAPKSEYLIQT